MIKHAILLLVVSLAGCANKPSESADAGATPTGSGTAAVTARAPAPAPTPAPANTYDQSCAKDDDCVVARGTGCCPQPCPVTIVNRRAMDKAVADLTAACGKEPPHPCVNAGACRTNVILCEKNKCGVFYEGDPGYRARTP